MTIYTPRATSIVLPIFWTLLFIVWINWLLIPVKEGWMAFISIAMFSITSVVFWLSVYVYIKSLIRARYYKVLIKNDTYENAKIIKIEKKAAKRWYRYVYICKWEQPGVEYKSEKLTEACFVVWGVLKVYVDREKNPKAFWIDLNPTNVLSQELIDEIKRRYKDKETEIRSYWKIFYEKQQNTKFSTPGFIFRYIIGLLIFFILFGFAWWVFTLILVLIVGFTSFIFPFNLIFIIPVFLIFVGYILNHVISLFFILPIFGLIDRKILEKNIFCEWVIDKIEKVGILKTVELGYVSEKDKTETSVYDMNAELMDWNDFYWMKGYSYRVFVNLNWKIYKSRKIHRPLSEFTQVGSKIRIYFSDNSMKHHYISIESVDELNWGQIVT